MWAVRRQLLADLLSQTGSRKQALADWRSWLCSHRLGLPDRLLQTGIRIRISLSQTGSRVTSYRSRTGCGPRLSKPCPRGTRKTLQEGLLQRLSWTGSRRQHGQIVHASESPCLDSSQATSKRQPWNTHRPPDNQGNEICISRSKEQPRSTCKTPCSAAMHGTSALFLQHPSS